MAAHTVFETTLQPRSIVVDPPRTDAEAEAFCRRSDAVQIGRRREGVIRLHAPTGGFTGNRNFEILRQLGNAGIGSPDYLFHE